MGLFGYLIFTLRVSKALFRHGIWNILSVKIMDFDHSDIDACYVKFLMQPSFLYHIQTDITPVMKGTKGIHLNEATLLKCGRLT